MTESRDTPTGPLPAGEMPARDARTETSAPDTAGGSAGDRRRWRALAARLGLEFAVVVFGVFIALWADARMAARAERRVEAARLEALASGITTSLTELREFITDVGRDRTLLRGVLAGPGQRQGTTAPLGEAVGVGLLGGTTSFHPQLVVYDDLRSSGELSLLEPDVRHTLSAMDQLLGRLVEAQQDMLTVQQLNFDSFAMRNVNLVPLLGPYLDLADVAAAGQAEYEALVGSSEFRNIVVFRLDLLTNVLDVANDLQQALETALAAVGDRLAQLR